MDGLHRIAARGYGSNATYIYEYSRGLNGVNIPRDVLFTRIIYWSVIGVALVIFCGRIAQLSHSYLRFLSSLGASRRQQTFWSREESRTWANIKKHILYAPISRKRHNREIQLSSAINVGTLPSRLQAILILLYGASQIAYCAILDYRVNERPALIAELRGRSGTLAVLNMVPLFLLAGRNNPLIPLLHISFDTYNLLHRWLGRIVVIESLVHTAAWATNAIDDHSLADMVRRLRDIPFFSWGLLGTCSMVFLVLHSPSPLRHAFYETFLHLHQLFAFLAFLGVYIHIDIDRLPQKPWIVAAGLLWLLDRAARLLRLLYLNLAPRRGATRLVVEALPGEACRVTFHLPRRVAIAPGSHVFAYIPRISWWMSHPFSVAWVEPSSSKTDLCIPMHPPTPSHLEKQPAPALPLDDYMHDPHQPTAVSLIISARQGMTRALYNAALAAPAGTLHTAGFIEGPYGAHPTDLGSYGTAVLFSAGAGITHHVLHVRDLIARAADARAATQHICLVWSVRSTDHLVWVQQWMDAVLRMPGRRALLTVKLFISKPKSSRDIVSPSASIQMLPGRCRPGVVLDEVLPRRVGATVVSVCGPGAFADEVRAAARANIARGMVVDFVEEAFTW
ncbi:ferric reductase like transmembrane component-domain-containing protein [Aspergillus ambiguus]|uniref:ferric reductase family protein n=1 Tax=Aspergillus ambiguus TaxID=176160 RepID=UPI003CCCE131